MGALACVTLLIAQLCLVLGRRLPGMIGCTAGSILWLLAALQQGNTPLVIQSVAFTLLGLWGWRRATR